MIVSDGLVTRCVGAVIHDSAGRLLLVKRGNEPGKGTWSVPGGRVEADETDQLAVQREVQEETGLLVLVGALLGRIVRPAPHGIYEIFDYSCRSSETALSPGDDAADAAWVDSATFATLHRKNALTEGLEPALRSWNCLPHPE